MENIDNDANMNKGNSLFILKCFTSYQIRYYYRRELEELEELEDREEPELPEELLELDEPELLDLE